MKKDYSKFKRCEKHDSHYDEKEDVWLENKCSDFRCQFCADRPEKPSMVDMIKDKQNDRSS